MGVPADEKICFVISPIGSDDSPQRQAADKLLKFIVRPIAEKFGYKVERADTIDKPGTITKQIIGLLVEAPLVIADMTNLNPNVFYELAVRHAAEKPVVHMIESGGQIPFDVAPERAIFYKLDLEGAEAAKVILERFVSAIEAGHVESESPLTNALERISLARSINPADQRESQMLETLQDIQVRLINLEAKKESATREIADRAELDKAAHLLWNISYELEVAVSDLQGPPTLDVAHLLRLVSHLREQMDRLVEALAGPNQNRYGFEARVRAVRATGQGIAPAPTTEA